MQKIGIIWDHSNNATLFESRLHYKTENKTGGKLKMYRKNSLRMYMNMEYGNIMSYAEMIEEGRELYDLDDPTNVFDYMEYYETVYI